MPKYRIGSNISILPKNDHLIWGRKWWKMSISLICLLRWPQMIVIDTYIPFRLPSVINRRVIFWSFFGQIEKNVPNSIFRHPKRIKIHNAIKLSLLSSFTTFFHFFNYYFGLKSAIWIFWKSEKSHSTALNWSFWSFSVRNPNSTRKLTPRVHIWPPIRSVEVWNGSRRAMLLSQYTGTR